MSSKMRRFWGGPPAAADSAQELEKLVPRVQELCTQPLAASLTEQGARRLLRDAMAAIGDRMRDLPEQVRATSLVDHVHHKFRRILATDPFELFAINESGLEGPQAMETDRGDEAIASPFSILVPRRAAEEFPEELSSWIVGQCASLGFSVTVDIPERQIDRYDSSEEPSRPSSFCLQPLDTRCEMKCDISVSMGEFAEIDEDAETRDEVESGEDIFIPRKRRRILSDNGLMSRCTESSKAVEGAHTDPLLVGSTLEPLAVDIDRGMAKAVFARESSHDSSLSRLETAVKNLPLSGIVLPNSQGWGRLAPAGRDSVHAGVQSCCVMRILPMPSAASAGSSASEHSAAGLWVPAALVSSSKYRDDCPLVVGWAEEALEKGEFTAEEVDALALNYVSIRVTPGKGVPTSMQEVIEGVANTAARKIRVFLRRTRLPTQEWSTALIAELRNWFPDTYLASRECGAEDRVFLACGLGADLIFQWLRGMVVFPFAGQTHPGFAGGAVKTIENNHGCSAVFVAPESVFASLMPDVIPEACLKVSSADKDHPKSSLLDSRRDSYWQSDAGPVNKTRSMGFADSWHWFEVNFPEERSILHAEMLCGGSSNSNFDPVHIRIQVGNAHGLHNLPIVSVERAENKEWFTLLRKGHVLRTTLLRVAVHSKGRNVRVHAIRLFTCPLGRMCEHVGILGPIGSRAAAVAALEAERSVCERAVRVTPGVVAVLRAHCDEFVRRTGIRAIRLSETRQHVLRLIGTAGPQGTIAACRKELERLIKCQAQAVQRERIAAMCQDVASALSHVDIRVPLSSHMRKLLSVSAFSAPVLGATGRPRPGSVSILEAVKAQQLEIRSQSREGSSNLARELRRRLAERGPESGPAGLMERLIGGGDDPPEHNVFSLMLRELRPRAEEPDRHDINVKAFTLWTQLEEYACDKIYKQIVRGTGINIPEDWGTRSAVTSMYPGLNEGQQVRYFKGGDLSSRQHEGQVVRVSPAVTAEGKARVELGVSIKAWLAATVEGTCTDPGRPTLATLVLQGDHKLHSLPAKAVQPLENTGIASPTAQNKEEIEASLLSAAVDVIGLKWAALMDEFLLAELGAVLRADVEAFVAKGVGLQAMYDAADRCRHRLFEMLDVSTRCATSIDDKLKGITLEAHSSADCRHLAEAANALSVQVRDTVGSWQATMQGSEHDAVRLTESLVHLIEKADKEQRSSLSCWDQLRQVSHVSGAFVTYSPPDVHLVVKGREAQVRDAVGRLRRLMLEDTGDNDREVSISLSQNTATQLSRHGGIMSRLIEVQAGLEHAALDNTGAPRLLLRGGTSQLARAAQLLGSSTPSAASGSGLTHIMPACIEDHDVDRCLVCLDSTPPFLDFLCGHRCHLECFQQDHRAKSRAAREVGKEEPFRCPASSSVEGAGGCNHILTTGEVMEAMGGGPAVLKHFEILVERKLQARPDKRSCTRCGALGVASSDSLPLTCTECGTAFCGSLGSWCGKRAHYFCSCEEFAQARVAQLRRRGDCASADALQGSLQPSSQWPEDVVLCARCRCPIDRQEGANEDCKYMRCRLCAYEFCWLCLQPADNHRHINPSNPRDTPECDNAHNASPENRERRRLAIIQGGCSVVSVPLARSQVYCDRCGKQETLRKVFACLECLNSYLCESCEPEGCIEDSSHVVGELEVDHDEGALPQEQSVSDERADVPDGFWDTEAPSRLGLAETCHAELRQQGGGNWRFFAALTGIERPLR
jgi:hypothetical protein